MRRRNKGDATTPGRLASGLASPMRPHSEMTPFRSPRRNGAIWEQPRPVRRGGPGGRYAPPPGQGGRPTEAARHAGLPNPMPEDTIRHLRNEIKGQTGRIHDLKHKLKFATAVDTKREQEINQAVDKYDNELVDLRDTYRRERRELNLEILRLREQLESRSTEAQLLRNLNQKLATTAENQQTDVAAHELLVQDAVVRRAQLQPLVDALVRASGGAKVSKPKAKPTKLSAGRFGKREKPEVDEPTADPKLDAQTAEDAYRAVEEAQAAIRNNDATHAKQRKWNPQELYVAFGCTITRNTRPSPLTLMCLHATPQIRRTPFP